MMILRTLKRQTALLTGELDHRSYPVTIGCVERFGPLIWPNPPHLLPRRDQCLL